MKNQNFDVNNLRVASPCSIGWETMSGDERVRHCHSCKTNIYNVAEMTKAEVEDLIAKREERVCMRLYRRADGTILTKDCPVGLRAYQKRVARFAGAALATILGLFSVSFGQQENEKTVDASKVKITRVKSQKNILSGNVWDEMGAVVPNVEIRLYKNDEEGFLKTVSDSEGNYRIELLSAGIYTLETKGRSGFKQYKAVNLKIKDGEKIQFNITLKIDGEVQTVGLVSAEEVIENSPSYLTTKITGRKIKKLPVKN